MLLSLRKNGLASLIKKIKVFKVYVFLVPEQYSGTALGSLRVLFESSTEKAHKHKEVTPKIGPQTPAPQTLRPPPLKILYALYFAGKMTPA